MADPLDHARARLAEHALLGAVNSQLAAIVESSDDAIISKDLNGTIISWNRGAERIFEYTADEVIGKSIRIIIPADRQKEEDHVLERIRRGEPIEHYETIRRTKTGRSVNISLTVSPVRNRDGKIVGASKIARDITLAKRAEEVSERVKRHALFLAQASAVLGESREVESMLRTLADLAVPHIADWCAIDLAKEDDEIVTVAMTHVDPAKVELAKLVRERHPARNAPFSPSYVIRMGTPAVLYTITDEMTQRWMRDDPESVEIIRALGLVSYLCMPMTAHDRTFGCLTLATESGRHYTEQDRQLAQDVSGRAALAIKYGQAYEQLELANRLKDEFLATLSHELRTPLNAVLGYARMLRAGTMSSDGVPRALDVMERNATALTQIVEDVLDVSRIVSGKVRLHFRPVDLRKVVRDACETVAPAAGAKAVQIEILIDPNVGPVAGDPDRLQQVLWNLLSNAVKFTPRNGRVQVELALVDSHVEVVVSDTGIGISSEFLPHMFERFRQAEGGTTRRHGGLGLGLAIARHIVEMHGGTIQSASEGEGKGSTFRIELPLLPVPAEKSPEPAPVQRPVAQTASTQLASLAGIRVLAVDDNQDALDLLREILGAAGAIVVTATSGAAAVQALQAAKADVLVVDLAMPDMDGFEFMRQVRRASDPALRQIPAAALTAYARSEDRAKALRSGFALHLSKPIDPAELLSAVAALSKRRPA